MQLSPILQTLAFTLPALALDTLVHTTSGPVMGSDVTPGVIAWKGIPFATPPTASRRWTPPTLNTWTQTVNTTALGPACIQVFSAGGLGAKLSQNSFNNPPLVEDEDCLTINIWAPSKPSTGPRAVMFWIYGGGFEFGGSGTTFYDGTSFAKNQDIILVSHNYRTNLFGFPNSPELALHDQNLGLLDQQLALSWTRDNVANFGGDPNKITLPGQPAGAGSAMFLLEHFSHNPPFRAAILESGVTVASNNLSPSDGSFSEWKTMASHFGCPSSNTTAQIDCLKNVTANDLKEFAADNSLNFGPQVDGGVTVSNQPVHLLETAAVARVPLIIGDTAQDASFNTIGMDNFTAVISRPPLNSLPADELRALYPVPERFLNDAQAVVALATDLGFICPSALFSDTWTGAKLSEVYRYVFGAVIPQFQTFPNAGTPHIAEVPFVFGNLNGTTNATQIELSNLCKQYGHVPVPDDPSQPPVPNWPSYTPTNKAVAALAFGSNVALNNIVNATSSSAFDQACQLLAPLDLA